MTSDKRYQDLAAAFAGQPMMTIGRLVGIGFPLGQAVKKVQEAKRMAGAALLLRRGQQS